MASGPVAGTPVVGRIGQTDSSDPTPAIRVGSWVFRPGLWVSHKVAVLQPDSTEVPHLLTECSRYMALTTARGRLTPLVPGVLYQPCADCAKTRGKPDVYLDEFEYEEPHGLPG